jgi:hypothetical protein
MEISCISHHDFRNVLSSIRRALPFHICSANSKTACGQYFLGRSRTAGGAMWFQHRLAVPAHLAGATTFELPMAGL